MGLLLDLRSSEVDLVPAYAQTAFRARNDDGSEITATWFAAENANWSQEFDANFRVRFEIEELAGAPAVLLNSQLQYRKNGSAWTNVNASSLVVRTVTSGNVLDDDPTTDQLTTSIKTFVGGAVDEVDGIAKAAAFSGEQSEVEFVLQLRSADLVFGDQVQLRLVTSAGLQYSRYDHIPTITAQPIFDRLIQTAFRGRNDNGDLVAATWITAENTDWTQDPDETFRVRIEWEDDHIPSGVYVPVGQLQYRRNAGAWTTVNASSSVVRTANSPFVADGAPITVSLLTTSLKPHATGEYDEANGTVSGGVAISTKSIEYEFALQIRDVDTNPGDTIQLRLTEALIPLVTYDRIPNITVGVVGVGAGVRLARTLVGVGR